MEMDLMTEEKRQSKMEPYLHSNSDDMEPSERKIKFHNVDQALHIHELDKFNKENTQRLMYELQAFDERLDQIKTRYQKYTAKYHSGEPNTPKSKEEWNKLLDEIEIVAETYTSLKYQIEGAKKKYFYDMRKIEDKMEKVIQIKREVQEEIKSNAKLAKAISKELQVIDSFPDKIKNLMEEINMNLNTGFARLEMVEEKIQENQDLLLKKKERNE